MKKIFTVLLVAVLVFMLLASNVFARGYSLEDANAYFESGDYITTIQICNDILNNNTRIKESVRNKIDRFLYLSDGLLNADKYFESGEYDKVVQICNDVLNSGYYMNEKLLNKINNILENAEKELSNQNINKNVQENVQGTWCLLEDCKNLKNKNEYTYIEFSRDGTCLFVNSITHQGTYIINQGIIECKIENSHQILKFEYSKSDILLGQCLEEYKGECCSYIKCIDVSAGINKASDYIEKEQWDDAINLCTQVLKTPHISIGDKATLMEIEETARNNKNLSYIKNSIRDNIHGIWKHENIYNFFGIDGTYKRYEVSRDGLSQIYNGTYVIDGVIITAFSEYGEEWFTGDIENDVMSLVTLKSREKLEDGSWWKWYGSNKMEIQNLQNDIYAGEDLSLQFKQIDEYDSNGLYLEIINLCNDLLSNHCTSIDDKIKLLNKQYLVEENYYKYIVEIALQNINNYNTNGMYLEIMQICDDLLGNQSVSAEDRTKLINERKSAKNSYDNYIYEQKKFYKSIITEETKNYRRGTDGWYKYFTCDRCHGSGFVICSICCKNGLFSPYLWCSMCDGTGFMKCIGCVGHGERLKFARSYSSYEQEIITKVNRGEIPYLTNDGWKIIISGEIVEYYN